MFTNTWSVSLWMRVIAYGSCVPVARKGVHLWSGLLRLQNIHVCLQHLTSF